MGKSQSSSLDYLALLPEWLHEVLLEADDFGEHEQRMKFVIRLAQLNVDNGTGGPFGAAVFERSSGRLVAVGVNLVTILNCSLAHAEMVAIALAQQSLASYDLGRQDLPEHELVTSCEPCAMCMGAIPWSGVRRVVCGARDEDARSIGFDEGPKIHDWPVELDKRGIEVVRDICRNSAVQVMQHYHAVGGEIYNSRKE